jgi:hypothetical protein
VKILRQRQPGPSVIPRKYPERNWSVSEKVQKPNGLVEDTIPEDQSLVLNTTPGRRKIKREGSVASGTPSEAPPRLGSR